MEFITLHTIDSSRISIDRGVESSNSSPAYVRIDIASYECFKPSRSLVQKKIFTFVRHLFDFPFTSSQRGLFHFVVLFVCRSLLSFSFILNIYFYLSLRMILVL